MPSLVFPSNIISFTRSTIFRCSSFRVCLVSSTRSMTLLFTSSTCSISSATYSALFSTIAHSLSCLHFLLFLLLLHHLHQIHPETHLTSIKIFHHYLVNFLIPFHSSSHLMRTEFSLLFQETPVGRRTVP